MFLVSFSPGLFSVRVGVSLPETHHRNKVWWMNLLWSNFCSVMLAKDLLPLDLKLEEQLFGKSQSWD
jgi:hypothetical protein